MVRILNNTDSQMEILRDGNYEVISWSSDLNTLVYKHGLEDLLIAGTEIVTMDTPHGTLTITPHDDADSFTIELGEMEVSVAKHQKTEFIETLRHVYEDSDDGLNTEAILDYMRDRLDTLVNPNVVDQFLDIPALGDHIESTDDGWLIHGLVLLTYDNKLYQPDTQRTNRTGEVVEGGSNKIAYEVRFQAVDTPDETGQAVLDSFEQATLGSEEDLVEFLTRALWAVNYVPEGVKPR